MARQFTFTSMFKLFVALLTALLIAVIGGVAVPAFAHDGGSGSGSSGSGSSGSSGSNSGPGPNSGPGNADCPHDNSGPGSSSSGPGPGDCPMPDPDDPDGDPGGDSGNGSTKNPSTSSGSPSGTTVAPQAPASTGTTQADVSVPTAVEAGVAGDEGLTNDKGSPSPLAVLAILLGLAMTGGAMFRRRARL